MSLKILMLQRKIDKKKEALEAKREEMQELQKREEELAQAVEEVETDEEQEVVEEEINEFEAKKKALEEEIGVLETELQELEEEAESKEAEQNEIERSVERKTETREKTKVGGNDMEERKLFGGITRERFEQLNQREDVKEFFERVRGFVAEKRAVTGAELLIPEVLVGILRDNLHNYSKLISKVWLRNVKGTGRVILPGQIPEAIWTEACARLNELDISFNEVEINGFKVGGYVAVCNATLEDAGDVDLYNEIMRMIAQAIGLATDKAIVYGTGKKMPLGIVPRLAQTTKPENYSPRAREWANLSTTNITTATGATGEELFADLIVKTGVAKSNYSNGVKTWIMNEETYSLIQSKLITFNAAGLIVANMNNQMPIINGEIVLLPFVPTGDVIGGYLGNYLLVERAGIYLGESTHVQFIDDNTVFKGTARYDGMPTIPEAFVAININGGAVTTEIPFAPDEANAVVEP